MVHTRDWLDIQWPLTLKFYFRFSYLLKIQPTNSINTFIQRYDVWMYESNKSSRPTPRGQFKPFTRLVSTCTGHKFSSQPSYNVLTPLAQDFGAISYCTPAHKGFPWGAFLIYIVCIAIAKFKGCVLPRIHYTISTTLLPGTAFFIPPAITGLPETKRRDRGCWVILNWSRIFLSVNPLMSW